MMRNMNLAAAIAADVTNTAAVTRNVATDYIVRALESKTQFGFEMETRFPKGRRSAAILTSKVLGTRQYGEDSMVYGEKAYYAVDSKGRKWKFAYDSTITADKKSQKCEVISPVLTEEDLPEAIEVIRSLRAAGAQGSANLGCGLHIHIDGKDFAEDPEKIMRLAQMWTVWEDTFVKFAKTDERRLNGYTKKWSHNTRRNERFWSLPAHPTMAMVNQAFYGYENNYPGHGNGERYYTLNLNNLWAASRGRKTIEFRLFETCLDRPELIAAYVYVLLSFTQRIKEMKRGVSRFQRKENLTEEYQFGYSLHLKGEKYKFVRELIKERLRRDGEGASPATRIRVEARQ